MAQAVEARHELDAPPWQRVESTLMATSQAVRRAYDRRFAEIELNLSQASLLAYVDEQGALSQTRLAAAMGLGRAQTGTLVDGLERRGLLERQPDANDRRVWLVATTRQGSALVRRVHEIDEVLRAELRAGISRAERQQLAQLLERLRANVGRVLTGEGA